MASIVFPPTPELNQSFTSGTVTWVWDGSAWVSAGDNISDATYWKRTGNTLEPINSGDDVDIEGTVDMAGVNPLTYRTGVRAETAASNTTLTVYGNSSNNSGAFVVYDGQASDKTRVSINNDGSAFFVKGIVSGADQVLYPGSMNVYQNSSSSTTVVYNGGWDNGGGRNITSTIYSDGTAYFKGRVTAEKAVHTYATADGDGAAAVQAYGWGTSGASNCFEARSSAGPVQATIKDDGSATFDSFVYSTRNIDASNNGSAALNGASGDGNLASFIAINRAGGGADETVVIKPDGSATFESFITCQSINAIATDNSASNLGYFAQPSTAGAGNRCLQLKHDGDVGNILIMGGGSGMTSEGNSGILITNDGTTKIGGNPSSTPNIELKADGSGTFLGRLQANRGGDASGASVIQGWGSDFTGSIGGEIGQLLGSGTLNLLNPTVGTFVSERRLKTNITPIDADTAWETIKSTPYYSYNWKNDPDGSVICGPMADEVPDDLRIATDRSDEVGVIHTYDTSQLHGRLYTALQTALTRIEELEAKVAALES